MRVSSFLLLLFIQKALAAASPTIALIAPMTGPNKDLGQKMSQGVSLYLDHFNQNGGLDGQKIELVIYDDQGDLEQAKKMAQVAHDSDALMVISNFSDSSKEIGDLYRNLKLPVITDSPQDNDYFNPWFFSMILGNRYQGVFIANYLYKVLNYKNAHIIYSDEKNTQVLKRTFELNFKGVGGTIKHQWMIKKSQPLDSEIDHITEDLLKESKSADVIFLATNPIDSAEIIVELKRKGINYQIFGSQSLTDQAFIEHLSTFPEEQFEAGYFSNQVMATAPLIFDISGMSAQIFKDLYQQKYNEVPDWLDGCFYDAAAIVVAGLKKIWSKDQSVADLRVHLKDAITGFNNPKKAVNGIAGLLYFNSNGDLLSSISVGQFFKQKFISTYTQLDYIQDLSQVLDLHQKILNEEILMVDGQYLKKTDVVFTGIDFMEVSDLDLKKSSYTLDFYLWFRYKGNVNASNIEFANQDKPIDLKKPFQKITRNGITYEAYRVEGGFRGNFNFSKYPVDHHDLSLQFFNKNAMTESIFYVRDEVGQNFGAEQLKQVQNSKALNSWTVTELLFFQDQVAHTSTFGDPKYFSTNHEVTISRYNAQIHIKRNVLSFAIKNFLPLFIILVLLYLVIFTDFATSISVYVGAILAIIFEHIRVSSELPGIGYTITLDYVFYGIYLFIVAQITITIIAENSKDDKKNLSETIIYYNKITYPVLFILSVLAFQYANSLFPFQPRKAAIIAKQSQVQQANDAKILTISTWNTDVGEGFDKVLKSFNQGRDFQLISKPVEYESYQSILNRQLESNIGPDIFYLEGIESLSQPIIIHNHTIALPNANHVLSDDEKRIWTSVDKKMHALPAFGFVNAVYYNQDIFRKLNLTVPKTWEEFLKAGHKLKNAGYLALGNGSKEYWASAQAFFMTMAPNFIGGYAGRKEYSDGKRCFNDSHVVNLFQAIKDLGKLLPAGFKDLNYYDGRTLFLEQKAAMWISASWELVNLSHRKDFSWSVFALPAPKNETTTVVFYADAAFAINANSKNIKNAHKFIDWVLTKEFEEVWQNNMHGWFSLNPEAPTPKDPQTKNFYELTKKYPTDFRWFLPAGVPDFYQLVTNATNQVLADTMTPKQAADSLQNGLVTWFRPAQQCLKNSQ